MLSSDVPEGYQFDFHEYLFNTERHRLTQAKEGWKSFYWLDEKRKLVKASFHVHIDGGIARSPYRATFGGIDGTLGTLVYINRFIESTLKELRLLGVELVELMLTPSNYNNLNQVLIFQSLLDHQFKLVKSSIHSIINVDEKPYWDHLNKTKRKLLSKMNGFEFKVEDISNFDAVYNCIKISRDAKEYDISLSYKELQLIVDRMIDDFVFFSLYDGKKMIASAITIKLSPVILYVFYAGHLTEYDEYSPLIKLYEQIYIYCKDRGIEKIDLGSSEENNITKESLLEFKMQLGAQPSIKPTFIKKLNG